MRYLTIKQVNVVDWIQTRHPMYLNGGFAVFLILQLIASNWIASLCLSPVINILAVFSMGITCWVWDAVQKRRAGR